MAPSGGFSTYFFFFPFFALSSFVYFTSLYSLTYETELLEGLIDESIADEGFVCDCDWLIIELELLEDRLFNDGCCDIRLLLDDNMSFDFDLSLIVNFEVS